MITREQAKKKLIELGIEQPTEEQITKYLNSVVGEVQKAEKKAEEDKAELERLKAIEEELEAEKEKNLTAEEKAKKAEEAVQKAMEAARLKEVEYAKKVSRLSVEKILAEAGLTEDDYTGFIDGIVLEDEEQSKKLATNLANTLNAKLTGQKEAMQAEFDKKLLESTPNPSGGASGGEGQSKAAELAVKLAKANTASTSGGDTIISHYIGGN